MKSSHLSSIIFVILVSSSLWSGTEGTIRGAVRNVEGEPLIGAQVYIGDLGVGAVADMDGNYFLINVPVGTFDVTASMLSYGTQVVSVDVIMDATQWMNFILDVEAIEGDLIRVSAEKALVEKVTSFGLLQATYIVFIKSG